MIWLKSVLPSLVALAMAEWLIRPSRSFERQDWFAVHRDGGGV
jgi:hypothetical protein